MPSASINGIDIAYTDEGSGTPIVFIHGYPLNRGMWEAQVRGLSAGNRVITIDLRGHGESQAPIWLASVDIYAADVKGLLDHLNIDRAVITGFSMGGYVAFAFLRNYPERVRALVLADTRPQPDAPEGKAARFQSALTAQEKGPGAIAEAMIGRLVSQKTLDERQPLVAGIKAMMETTTVQGIAGDLMSMAERPDSVPMLASIAVPTLIVVGEADALTPVADSQLMASSIPGAKIEIIPGAGHLANMEEPEHFNRVVGDFVSSLA